MVAVIGLYLVLALAFTMSKGVLLHAQPVFFTGVRMIVAGITLLAYYRYIQKKKFILHNQDLLTYLQLAFFHVFVTYVFEFWALETISASTDALFFNLSPFITALLSLILCNERLSGKQWLGLLIGFVGFLPLFYAQQTVCGSSLIAMVRACLSFSKAELLLIIAVASSAYGWILMQRLVRTDHYSPVFINGVSMLWGGIMALIVSLLTETTFIKTTGPHTLWSYDIPMFLWYLAVLIILTNFISYNVYGLLLKRYSATLIALAGGLTPIFTAFFDWILLGEYISWHFVATVCLVALGLCIFYIDEFKSIRKPVEH
ncbi:MAG TPA: DMT family transporter [Candidatus Babeliales bacterium]|jgi:drug/metabolite transporter (DMT)-like permease|nr:DMT family transporter [Candidatus Babeliales bacterium]